MKTSEVASRLGVAPNTIYKYSIEPLYANFLSEDARREGGRQQSVFNEDDVIVIWTIYRLRRKMPAEDVAIQLREGYRANDLPVDGAGAIDKAVDNIRALGIVHERDAALAKIDDLQEEVDRLRTEKVADAQEIGRLKGEIEFMKRALPEEIRKLLGLE